MKSLVNRIYEAYSELSMAERKVADVVLDFPGEIATYSASELARLADVSKSTVTRFVHDLGFKGYEEVRHSSREERQRGSPLFLTAKDIEAESLNTPLLTRFADEEVAMLTSTVAGLSPELVNDVAEALAGARRLYFFGFRNNYYFAAFARWQFIQFRHDVHLIPGAGETIGESIADLDSGDMVITVGVRRRLNKLHRYLEAIRQTGTDILLLTDPSARITPAYARWTITCHVENQHVFDYYGGILFVLRLLAFETYQKLDRNGREHLKRVEDQHEGLQEFD